MWLDGERKFFGGHILQPRDFFAKCFKAQFQPIIVHFHEMRSRLPGCRFLVCFLSVSLPTQKVSCGRAIKESDFVSNS